MDKQNLDWKLVMDLGNGFAVLHNEKSCTQYNLANGYKPETNTWDYGHYVSSFDMALVVYLDLRGNDWIKTDYQHKVEETSEINFMRMSELATLFKDGLIEDDRESAIEYFEDSCEMTEKEMKYFGITDEED